MIINLLRKFINNFVWFIGISVTRIFYIQKPYLNRIAILYTNVIGDFILFTPSLKYIRENYRNFHITIIMRDQINELAEGCPYVDEIVTYNDTAYRKNIFYKLLFLLKLFKLRFDICLYPVYSRERIGDEMVLWSGAQEKIGWDTEHLNMEVKEKKKYDKVYTTLFKSTYPVYGHILEKNKEFLFNLGIQVDRYKIEFWNTDEEKNKIKDFLEKNKLHQKNIIAIIPGALRKYREWGAYKYKALMEKIIQVDKKACFVIVGSASEKDIIKFNEDEDGKSNVLNLCGIVSLKELFPLFAQCKLVIGNETGPMHIAIDICVSTVCILGGGHFGMFMPYGNPEKNKFVYKEMDCFRCSWKCIYPKVKCIEEITVEEVYKEVEKLLQI